MAGPTRVGARELKTRLGTYLKQVRAGRTLIVTNRGEPVAELRPLRLAPSGETEAQAWERLYATGIVTRPVTAAPAAFRPLPGPSQSLTAALIEERDEERDQKSQSGD